MLVVGSEEGEEAERRGARDNSCSASQVGRQRDYKRWIMKPRWGIKYAVDAFVGELSELFKKVSLWINMAHQGSIHCRRNTLMPNKGRDVVMYKKQVFFLFLALHPGWWCNVSRGVSKAGRQEPNDERQHKTQFGTHFYFHNVSKMSTYVGGA